MERLILEKFYSDSVIDEYYLYHNVGLIYSEVS